MHPLPPGRYYQLESAGEFLLVDLCFFAAGASDRPLEVERHGRIRHLFDKGDWLRPRALDETALAAKREERHRELQTWFPVSQSFVRKAILRGQHVEAMHCFWGYTLRPLVELLRMRHCPARWDFGMRNLDRDLPCAAYERVRELLYVRDLEDLADKLPGAVTWGAALLQELESAK
jgi:hypothetical protein